MLAVHVRDIAKALDVAGIKARLFDVHLTVIFIKKRLLFDDFIQIIPIPDLTGQLRIQRIKRRILLLAAQITLLPLHAVREVIANRIRDFFIILIVRRRNIGFIRGFAGGRVRRARLYA